METKAAKIIILTLKGYTATPKLRKKYQLIINFLIYVMLEIKLNIAYVISIVSKFAANPTPTHIKAVKKILQYFKSTLNLKFIFNKKFTDLTSFSNAN